MVVQKLSHSVVLDTRQKPHFGVGVRRSWPSSRRAERAGNGRRADCAEGVARSWGVCGVVRDIAHANARGGIEGQRRRPPNAPGKLSRYPDLVPNSAKRPQRAAIPSPAPYRIDRGVLSPAGDEVRFCLSPAWFGQTRKRRHVDRWSSDTRRTHAERMQSANRNAAGMLIRSTQ